VSTRHAIAVDLGRRRLRALYGVAEGGVLRVQRRVVAKVPEHVDPEDPEAVGRWVGFQLRQAGIPTSRATIALAREHVSVKRLTLPTSDADELPDMARLALRRELTFDPDQAVIDFVPIEQAEAATTVIAVAAPEPVLDHQRRVVKSAGVGVGRISLRSQGTAALIGHGDESQGDGSVLVIDITGDGVEFSFVHGGCVLFTRAAELPDLDDPEAAPEAVITETRRTWMSYRIGQDSREVTSAVLIGPLPVVDRVIGPVKKMLSVETRALDAHPMVEAPEGPLETLWPLAGLLLEPMTGAETFDFAHPRQAPDRAGHRRQRVIVAAALVVLTVVAAWTVAGVRLDRLEQRLADVRTDRARARPKYQRLRRDAFRLEHLRQWESVEVDWLEHASYLLLVAPAPDHLVLDSWAGSLNFRGVRYDDKSDLPDRWSAPREITIVLDGEAVDRATADAFRESLVEGELYITSSTGTDARGGRRLPYGFTYRLRTTHGAPLEEEQPPDGMAAGEGAP
jgi:Tfp pilus assembly PilM family ATPase